MFDEVAPPRDVSQLRLPLIGSVNRDVSAREPAKQDPADAPFGVVDPIARRDHETGRAIGGQPVDLANKLAGELHIAQLDIDRGDTVTDQIIEQRALGSGAAQLAHHGNVIGDQTDPRSRTFDKGIGAGRRVADVLGAVQQRG